MSPKHARRDDPPFPWGTFLVVFIVAFLIGSALIAAINTLT